MRAGRLIVLNVLLFMVSMIAVAQRPVFSYAQKLLTGSHKEINDFELVQDLGHDEAFRIVRDGEKTILQYQTDAGILYGVQALIRNEYMLEEINKPDFNIRGTTLPMFKGEDYKATLSPATFPWFYDKDFMIQTLDVFANARINVIFLWGSHLFPYIVEMPKYPEASSDVSTEQIRENQRQFLWFTRECEKRNIKVLLHFYNIHVSQPFAKEHGIKTNPTTPTPLLIDYTRYALSRYFEEFPSVGLYACPGESIHSNYQLEWFRDVIFDTAEKSGKNPMIVIRDWTLNHDFRKQLKTLYSNCFSELKQNDESISSPYPDIRHMKLEGVASGHIVNAAHGPAQDLVPMRWANPLLIKEMAQHWKSLGFVSGVEFWGQAFWDWPYTYDKVEPRLKYIERDAPFYEAIGRYMWDSEKEVKTEEKYWDDYYAKRFGSEEVGKLIAKWYEVSGSIGPGLLNLNATRVANWWSAVVLMNQSIDTILQYNISLDEVPYTLNREAGRANQRYYPRPFDNYFFKRYKSEYELPLPGKNPEMFQEFYPYAERMKVTDLAQRKCLPVTQYAKYLVNNQTVDFALTPDKTVRLLNKMAEEAFDLANKAVEANTNANLVNELNRFVIDSRIFILATEALAIKENAAIIKACILLDPSLSSEKKQEFIETMEKSLEKYLELYEFGQKSYSKASFRTDWSLGLKEFEEDLKKQKSWIEDLNSITN